MKKVLIDKNELYKYYVEQNKNIQEVADLLHTSYRTVQRAIKDQGFTKNKEDISKTRKQTMIEKYGVENSYQLDSIKAKIKQTKLERYGDELYNNPNKQKQTMLDKYGVKCGYNLPDVQNNIVNKYGGMGTASKKIGEKVKQTCLEKYGVPYFCMREECSSKNGYTISKINKQFAKILESNNIKYSYEFHIKNKSFDFKIDNNLIELNPTYTHNSTNSVWFHNSKRVPISTDYHFEKSKLAIENNYRCIHIWDWDDVDKIVNMLIPKINIYARKCIIKELSIEDCNLFLSAYHLQNACKGQNIRLGLYYNNDLIQVMTFGKPRYNKNYEYELLRLCTKSGYKVIGGSKKLFNYFIKNYNPQSIISYCDNSKFSGTVYNCLGFILKDFGSPSIHWFDGKRHITDNLLRQRGFDQLFNTNYGKGTSNRDLMIQHGFVEVYDCGQSSYVWNGDKNEKNGI